MSEDEQKVDSKVKEHLRQTLSDKCSTIGGRKVYFGLNESMIRQLTPVEEVLTPVPTPDISDSEFSQTSNEHSITWTLSDGFIVHTVSEESDTDVANVKPRSETNGVDKPKKLTATINTQGTGHKEGEKYGSNAKVKLINGSPSFDVKTDRNNGSTSFDKDKAKRMTNRNAKSASIPTQPSDGKTKLARVNKERGLPAIPPCTNVDIAGDRTSKRNYKLSTESKLNGQNVQLLPLQSTASRALRKTGTGNDYSHGKTSAKSLPPIGNGTAPTKGKRATSGRRRKEDYKCAVALDGNMTTHDGTSASESRMISGFTQSRESRPGYYERAAVSPKMEKSASQLVDVNTLLSRRKEKVGFKTVEDCTQLEAVPFILPSLHSNNKLPPILSALPEIERKGQRKSKSGKEKQKKNRKKRTGLSSDIEQLLL